jgi:hypothetical protein
MRSRTHGSRPASSRRSSSSASSTSKPTTSLRRDVAPPSGGTPPPSTARLPDGELLHLTPVAEETSRRFWAEYADEAEHYGDAGFAWCVHDNQWLLGWAAEDFEIRGGHFVRNVHWLAGVLAARDYPSECLARDLEIAADVVGEEGDGRRRLAGKLRQGARAVRRN